LLHTAFNYHTTNGTFIQEIYRINGNISRKFSKMERVFYDPIFEHPIPFLFLTKKQAHNSFATQITRIIKE